MSLLRVIGEEIFARGQDPCQEKCHSTLAGVAFVDSLLGMVDPFGKLAESNLCSCGFVEEWRARLVAVQQMT